VSEFADETVRRLMRLRKKQLQSDFAGWSSRKSHALRK
jgi:hypothetical protein